MKNLLISFFTGTVVCGMVFLFIAFFKYFPTVCEIMTIILLGIVCILVIGVIIAGLFGWIDCDSDSDRFF